MTEFLVLARQSNGNRLELVPVLCQESQGNLLLMLVGLLLGLLRLVVVVRAVTVLHLGWEDEAADGAQKEQGISPHVDLAFTSGTCGNRYSILGRRCQRRRILVLLLLLLLFNILTKEGYGFVHATQGGKDSRSKIHCLGDAIGTAQC